jgi:chromosomal replication initiation ATPase DnaA
MYELVLYHTGVNEEQLKSRWKTQDLAQARKLFSLLARKQNYSYPAIGRMLNRHHTSIMNLIMWSKIPVPEEWMKPPATKESA